MRKIFTISLLLLSILMATSCSDNELSEVVPVRDYQTDALVLSKFVDINKTIGEYYINENKKNSPLSYVSDKDWQELSLVNPVIREKFENELDALNSQLAIAAQRQDVSQIVYSTYSETWIRTINHDAPVLIKQSTPEEITAQTRSQWASLQLQAGALNEANFHAGPQIKSQININMFGYKYYYFELQCKIDAKKTPESSGYPAGSGDSDKVIVMSGNGSIETWNFTWNATSSDSDIYWKFKGYLYNPTAIGSCLITINFTD